MSGDVVVRRATPDDYVSVLNMIDDLWDGDDYFVVLCPIAEHEQRLIHSRNRRPSGIIK